MTHPEFIDDKALRTAADRVFEALQDAIVRGDIPPGSRVGETELAERYGTSRGPLREALRRLESRRLVERTPHVGIRIAALGHAALIELYYLREALEGMAARLAALHMTAAEVAGLKTLLAAHEADAALQADTAYFQQEGDFDFHYRVIQGSHNSTLTELLIGELYHRIRMYRYQFSAYANRPRKAFAEHQRIVEAIETRDGDLAEMLMRRHISSARQNIEKHLKENA
ncbi:MAG: GntR family transcriptional regulator [Gammaproteobacteria bacterium]|nr:GntR family transcriptional regulator [Gammaproteobacteria bacterium]